MVIIINTYIEENIFGKDCLTIFTDASMKKLRTGEQIGCIGSILVHGELRPENLEDYYIITRDSTNNDSEIKAVRLGIEMALRYNYKKVRLFSDSQISIYGIRERIFNWKIINNSFIGTSGDDIKNQIAMIEIVNTILENKLEIEFYHQKGHVIENDISSLINATHVFKVSNNVREDISLDFIKVISYMNNLVDIRSGEFLYSMANRLGIDDYREAINFNNLDRHFNKNEYLSLIKYK